LTTQILPPTPIPGGCPRPSPQRTISIRFFPTRLLSSLLRRRFPRAQLPLPVRDFSAVTTTTLGRTSEAGGLGWGFTDTTHAAHTSGQGFTHVAHAAHAQRALGGAPHYDERDSHAPPHNSSLACVDCAHERIKLEEIE
jgi:hypothetical protein